MERNQRASVQHTPNQVGGGLGDYMAQKAIDDGSRLNVIDGFGDDLDNIDTACGPIRERVYEIICANLEPGSQLLQSLRQINAVKDMALYEWILEMDAIYFDINPEMGLQAQHDFQTLVYEHLYTTISFFILLLPTIRQRLRVLSTVPQLSPSTTPRLTPLKKQHTYELFTTTSDT
jgi:hypothetical protein